MIQLLLLSSQIQLIIWMFYHQQKQSLQEEKTV